MATFITENQEQTIRLAKKLAEHLKPRMTILLKGQLGAGKTTFSKGIGAGLGVKRVIKSPSYTIIREYQEGRLPFYHIDLYRLEEGEAGDLGLEEYFDGDGVTVVEWASVAPEELPSDRLEIKITTFLDDLDKRSIEMQAIGQQYKDIVEQLATEQSKTFKK